jgi:hypothetical protein
MGKKIITACVAALAILTLTGCLRQSAYYYVQPDDTVDGTIYVALDEAYTNADDPYRGTGADDIAAFFHNATITPFDNGKWKGYHIDFVDEPLATFADAPTETWGVQIVKVGTQYVAHGYTPTADDDSMRQAIEDDDGFMRLTISFPGTLVEQTGADETSDAAEKPGWASWDMLTVDDTPYAKGNGGLLFHLIPGIVHLFDPEGDPVPNPSTSPAEPAPVVTVVVTPSPVETPSPSSTPSTSPSASPSAVVAAPSESDSSIPVWVWIVGAVLLVALAGLGGVLAATMRAKKALPAVQAPEPESTPAAKPEAKPKAKPKAKPEAEPAKDDDSSA